MSTAEENLDAAESLDDEQSASEQADQQSPRGKGLQKRRPRDDEPGPSLGKKVIRWGIAAVVAVVIIGTGLVLWTQVLPRWWAQQIGKMTGGTLIGGAIWGALVGFALTLIPLLLIGLGIARQWRWVAIRVVLIVVGLVLALPNLITLSVSVAPGKPNEVARTTLDISAPFFRGASIGGAIVAALVAIGIWTGGFLHWWRKRKLDKLEKKVGADSSASKPSA